MRTVLLSLALTGCVSPDRAERASDTEAAGSEGSTGPSLVDEDAVMDRAFDYAAQLVQLNDQPEPGTHGDAADINYFSLPENLELFKTIDPELTDQQVSFIQGAMFVKEHLDNSGAQIGFTVMYKAPPGFFPEANDWWWGRVSEGSITHSGQVNFCVDCHVMVDNTDYVYGVPLENRRE